MSNESENESNGGEPGVPDNETPGSVKKEIIYDDDSVANAELLLKIKQYADEIKCSDFHGKGTIEDYKSLFQAAGKIANEVKRVEMDIDIEGFKDFGQAADDLSALFESFTIKLQNLTIVDDTAFLNAVASSLAKIVNLSNVFGRFKRTVTATATIKLPRAVQDTASAVAAVIDEVSCAMGYISYFVDPSTTGKLPNAELCDTDKKDMEQTVNFINTFQQQTVCLDNDDIVYIKQANTDFKIKTATLKKLTVSLRSKIAN